MKLWRSIWTWKRRQCVKCLWRGEWQTTKITHYILQEEKSRWIKTKLSPTRKKGRFTINKGQSTKGKPSFNDTCFFCKKHGHWKNVMNWNKPLSKCGISKWNSKKSTTNTITIHKSMMSKRKNQLNYRVTNLDQTITKHMLKFLKLTSLKPMKYLLLNQLLLIIVHSIILLIVIYLDLKMHQIPHGF